MRTGTIPDGMEWVFGELLSSAAATVRRKQIARDDEARTGFIRGWIVAALVDGWTLTPTYPGGESEATAGRLKRDGFVVGYLLRPDTRPSICGWCPKGISIGDPLTFPYSWNSVVGAARTCEVCKATDVDTVRVAFANRACGSCAPGLAAKLETPGWCD